MSGDSSQEGGVEPMSDVLQSVCSSQEFEEAVAAGAWFVHAVRNSTVDYWTFNLCACLNRANLLPCLAVRDGEELDYLDLFGGMTETARAGGLVLLQASAPCYISGPATGDSLR